MSKPPTRAGRTKPSKDNKGRSALAEKQPAALLEIVPGKFNENDWNNMLEIEDNQEFVWEIVDEIVGNSMKIIYDKYIQQQTIPYVISEARRAIVHIIDWQFLTRDVNDDLEQVWVEDQEPESCVIDSWAQGYVETVPNEPEETKEAKEGEFMQESEQNKVDMLDDEAENLGDLRPTSKSTSTKTLSSTSRVRSLDDEVKQKIEASKQKAAKLREKRRLLDAIARRRVEFEEGKLERGPSAVTSTQETKKDEPIMKAPLACHSILKTMLSRPAALREIEIDSFGQIQSLAKLELDKIPMTGVKVRYSVMSDNNKNQLLNGLVQPSKKDQSKSSENSKPSLKSKTSSATNTSKISRFRKSPPRRTMKSNFIDQEDEMMIEPVSGVIFTMMNSTRAGPKRSVVSMKHQLMFEKSETQLRPVRRFDSETAAQTRSSLEEILTSNIDNIKMPTKLKPIPPINSNSSTTVK